MGTVLIIDGNSLTHRAWHAGAAQGRTDPKLAWAGVLGMIAGAVRKTKAEHLLLAFDDPDSSLRKLRMPLYKAGRLEKQPKLEEALRGAPAFFESLGLKPVVKDGLEADDILAAGAHWAAKEGQRAILVTSDRDSFALIDSNTQVLRLVNGGIEQAELYDREELKARYGVEPETYRLYAAIRGDKSDNLPGVEGIGEKGAAEIAGIAATYLQLEKAIEEGALRKGLVDKLKAEGMLERVDLNISMMSFEQVKLCENDISHLPLKMDEIRRWGLSMQSRWEVLQAGVMGAVPEETEPEDSGSWEVNPQRTQTLLSLKEYWDKHNGAQELQEKQAAFKEEVTLEKAEDVLEGAEASGLAEAQGAESVPNLKVAQEERKVEVEAAEVRENSAMSEEGAAKVLWQEYEQKPGIVFIANPRPPKSLLTSGKA